jgi:hypothetical protein
MLRFQWGSRSLNYFDRAWMLWRSHAGSSRLLGKGHGLSNQLRNEPIINMLSCVQKRAYTRKRAADSSCSLLPCRHPEGERISNEVSRCKGPNIVQHNRKLASFIFELNNRSPHRIPEKLGSFRFKKIYSTEAVLRVKVHSWPPSHHQVISKRSI